MSGIKILTLQEFSSRGGKARAAKLTPERRREISQMGVRARQRAKRKEKP